MLYNHFIFCIGMMYDLQFYYEKNLEYCRKSIDIRENTFKSPHSHTEKCMVIAQVFISHEKTAVSNLKSTDSYYNDIE